MSRKTVYKGRGECERREKERRGRRDEQKDRGECERREFFSTETHAKLV